MSTGFKDMHGNELSVGDIIESTRFGTRLEIIRDHERNCFGGDYYPTKYKPNGYGVWDIKLLDFSDYFKVKKDD